MANGSKRIGGISVGMSLDSNKFNSGLKTASKNLTGFDRTVSKTSAGLKAFGALVGGVSVAASARFVKSNMDSIAAISELSTKTGISTTVLGGYTLAAEEAGIASKSFEKGIITMTRNTRNAAAGLGEISKVYERLGVNAETLNALAPDKQFLLLSDAINKVKGSNDQLTATMDIFGSKQSDFVNLIRGGRDALNEATQAARDMGLVVEDQMAKRIDAASESIDRFKKQLGSLGVKGEVGVTPFVEGINELIDGLQFAKQKDSWLKQWLPDGWVNPNLKGGWEFEGPSGFAAPEQLDPFKKFVQQARTDKEVFDFRMQQAIGGIRSGAVKDSLIGGFNTIRDRWKASQSAQKANRDGMMGAFKNLLGSNDPVMTAPKSLTDAANNMAKLLVAFGPLGRGIAAGAGAAGQSFKGAGRGMMHRPALAFAESDSADSFRQQAAIRRQSEGIAKQQLKVGEKQLVELKEIRKNVGGGMPLNLARR